MTLLAEAPATSVLAALRREHTDERVGAHGIDLVRDTGLASGTVYTALYRLERAGWVTAAWDESGRRRYEVPTDGIVRADAEMPAGADQGRIERQSWLLVAVIAAMSVSAALSHRLSDLGVYMGAVTGLRHGDGLYDFVAAGNAPFTYPPFAGLFFWPLSYVPTSVLEVAWTAMTVATVAALAVLIAGTGAPTAHRGDTGRPGDLPAAAVAVALFLSAPIASDLKYGQVSIYLAGLVMLDVMLLGRSRWQGALIGLAAAVKLTPLVFIPMFWCAGRRRAALVATSVFAACGLLAFMLLPADSTRFWDSAMWQVSRLGAITSAGNQSFDGALLRLGVPDPTRSAAMLIVGLTVAAIALRRSTLLARGGDRMSAMIVVGAAGVVASPVSWTHHQVWLVMAAMLPVRCRSVRARWAWAVAVLAVMILPVTTFALLVPGPLGLLLRNARLLTAILIACVVPLAVTDNHVPSPHLRRRARASSRPPELAAYGTNGPDPPGAGFRSL